MRLNLSRPRRTILGIGLLVLLAAAVLVAAFYFLPLLWGGNGVEESPLAQASPGTAPSRRAVMPEPHPQQTAGLAGPTHPSGQPTLLAEAATAPSAPSATPLPRGNGDHLPQTSTGLPWFVPIGLIVLLIVAWWRWQRSRAAG